MFVAGVLQKWAFEAGVSLRFPHAPLARRGDGSGWCFLLLTFYLLVVHFCFRCLVIVVLFLVLPVALLFILLLQFFYYLPKGDYFLFQFLFLFEFLFQNIDLPLLGILF